MSSLFQLKTRRGINLLINQEFEYNLNGDQFELSVIL